MHDIIVIGAGIAGTLTALELANKGYKVALIEAGSQVLPPTSSTQNECNKLHTGMHYLGDIKTAEHCLTRAIEFAKKYPEFLAGKDNLSSPCRRGRHYVIGESLVSPEEAEQITHRLRALYQERIDADPTNEVFGKVEHFIQKLKPEEYNFISNTIPISTPDGEKVTSVAVAYETGESQVDIIALQKHLQAEVDSHANIEFIPNSRVTDLGLMTEQFGYYVVASQADGYEIRQEARGIVNCAWQNIELLDKKLEPQTAGVNVSAGPIETAASSNSVNRVKVSLLVKLPQELTNLNTCIFSSGPFFSITNLGDGTAILTSERFTNVGYYPVGKEMPEALQEKLAKLKPDTEEGKTFAKNIIDDCAACFAGDYKELFKQAELLEFHVGFVKQLDMQEAYTQTSIYQKGSAVHARQLDGVISKPNAFGYISNSGMKMTYAVNNAEQVSQRMDRDFRCIMMYEDLVQLVKNQFSENFNQKYEEKIDTLLYGKYRERISGMINQHQALMSAEQSPSRPIGTLSDEFKGEIGQIAKAIHEEIKFKHEFINPSQLGVFNPNKVINPNRLCHKLDKSISSNEEKPRNP
ncbi:bifunctional tRNA (mnm(5)s(2)U34)-methyltransferase/FAD-dependent cmnm(5)s(2)U34 oxidoreductase [Legionella beliardensis]|uniref:Bifunctional tRNA (Mnm(5)s(2)U34)-methyltransferase/FAD-dependent cmnm(5)s(2)U34 oxidoreductase n=1 Tax=Legionella beliardensis TaxID=91822 RepID=A0A378I4L0_9GAMM|nr:FAD-dependent oxidoreductase [Legionella beliardensis]STX29690.1 bifunctional tRNA (mnm(5)s(2)U34)-methyltransferase/FAD-dependent cmnm(5)s(2)U34 oxidoreductase [Legionella beliardensis]